MTYLSEIEACIFELISCKLNDGVDLYLFGSLADGKICPNDIDIMVVYLKEYYENAINIRNVLRSNEGKFLLNFKIPLNLLVLSRGEFREFSVNFGGVRKMTRG